MSEKQYAPPIAVINSAAKTEKSPNPEGIPEDVYVGVNIPFTDQHSGDTVVNVGLWEAGISNSYLMGYPFTEYVLMISGRVIITNEDGSSNEFKAGDTFVIPKGFSGSWDIKEPMKKQMVQIGDPNAPVRTRATNS